VEDLLNIKHPFFDIFVYEKYPFRGFSSMNRAHNYGWSFYTGEIWTDGPIRLSEGNQIQSLSSTYIKTISEKSIYLFSPKLLWLLHFAHYSGIHLRVNFDFVSSGLKMELLDYYGHELDPQPEIYFIYGDPGRFIAGNKREIYDVLTEEKHSEIYSRSRMVINMPNRFGYKDGGPSLHYSDGYRCKPRKKYYFPYGTVFAEKVRLVCTKQYVCAIFKPGKYQVYIPGLGSKIIHVKIPRK